MNNQEIMEYLGKYYVNNKSKEIGLRPYGRRPEGIDLDKDFCKLAV
jgi:hypothetical protein